MNNKTKLNLRGCKLSAILFMSLVFPGVASAQGENIKDLKPAQNAPLAQPGDDPACISAEGGNLCVLAKENASYIQASLPASVTPLIEIVRAVPTGKVIKLDAFLTKSKAQLDADLKAMGVTPEQFIKNLTMILRLKTCTSEFGGMVNNGVGMHYNVMLNDMTPLTRFDIETCN